MRAVVTEIDTTLCKLLYGINGINGTIEEAEVIIENRLITFGICIWFCENLLM